MNEKAVFLKIPTYRWTWGLRHSTTPPRRSVWWDKINFFWSHPEGISDLFIFSCLGWHDLQSFMVLTLTLANRWLSNCCLKYQRIQLPVILQPSVHIYPMQWFKREHILKHASTSLYEHNTASITQHFDRHLLSFLPMTYELPQYCGWWLAGIIFVVTKTLPKILCFWVLDYSCVSTSHFSAEEAV